MFVGGSEVLPVEKANNSFRHNWQEKTFYR